jgi:hypothetical protein
VSTEGVAGPAQAAAAADESFPRTNGPVEAELPLTIEYAPKAAAARRRNPPRMLAHRRL